ncbi:putative starch synthase 4 [Nymphaea thermarum]|nr:putative starch synthase 4 [Nymphaea thermarum]
MPPVVPGGGVLGISGPSMGSLGLLTPPSSYPIFQCRHPPADNTISELRQGRHHGRSSLLGRRVDQGSGFSSRANESVSPMIFAARQSSTVDFAFKKFAWPSPDDEVPFWKRDFPVWNPTLDATADAPQDPDPLHIIHVTAEMAPIAKVGGLGDVVTGLSRASMLRGHKVEVMLPFYECIQKHQAVDDRTIGHNPERLSLLKGGIVYSNAVVLGDNPYGDPKHYNLYSLQQENNPPRKNIFQGSCWTFPRIPKLGRWEPNAPSTLHNDILGPCTACALNK